MIFFLSSLIDFNSYDTNCCNREADMAGLLALKALLGGGTRIIIK